MYKLGKIISEIRILKNSPANMFIIKNKEFLDIVRSNIAFTPRIVDIIVDESNLVVGTLKKYIELDHKKNKTTSTLKFEDLNNKVPNDVLIYLVNEIDKFILKLKEELK